MAFFTEYNPLTTEYVDAKVAEKAKADCGKDCTCLAGLSFTFRSESPFAPDELKYDILDGKTLKVTENGQTYTAPYAYDRRDNLFLFTHLIPGTSRAWHIILDNKTWAVTAFETWFGITVPVGYDLAGTRPARGRRDIPREIQRQYYFGWADKGDNEKPAALHTTTNRIEGRGLHWEYSTGLERLTFYPSVICCTVVELGQEMGSITQAFGADYIKIDDENYIVSNWETEYGGKMRIDVLNFFEMEAFGMEFGFEADDSLTYRMTCAKFELTGDCAHLESITSAGDKGQIFRGYGEVKGARYAYRPMDIDIPMTREEALAHAAEKQDVLAGSAVNIMQSFNHLPFCYDLVGRQFTVQPDNPRYAVAPWSGKPGNAIEYDVFSKDMLRWRIDGGEWKEDRYACFQSDKELYFFSHIMSGDPDVSCMSQVIDFRNGLTTTVKAGIGNWHSEWEAGADVYFGTLKYKDIKPPFAARHHFTDELVGKCFAWCYGANMQSIHLYSSPESYSWTIFQGDNSGGACWSSPCFYIKIRPEVYLLQWVEEKCNGSQGLVIFNRKTQHDSGFFYGVNEDGLRLQVTGAFMRELGSFDIKKYFGRGIR